MSRPSEAARQAAVLAALRAPLAPNTQLNAAQTCWPALQAAHLDTDAAGLLAYQLNAQAAAQRVLAAHFPTVLAMIGEEALAGVARALWQSHPPTSGDLGEWGGALPACLAAQRDLHAWPWLADSARLDWARHRCERAADALVDTDSLTRLTDTDPAALRLVLKPDTQIVASDWPIADLWTAHRLPLDQQAEAARQTLQDGGRQTVLVWRQNWQVQMACLPTHQRWWMQQLLSGNETGDAASLPSLDALLNQAPAGFDFTAWLSEALVRGWLWRVAVYPDRVDQR
jgi:hypothetical protein